MHKTLEFGILFVIFEIPLYSLSMFTTSKFIKWCSKIDDAIRAEHNVLGSKLIKFAVSHGLKLRALSLSSPDCCGGTTYSSDFSNTCLHWVMLSRSCLVIVVEELPTVQTSQVLV